MIPEQFVWLVWSSAFLIPWLVFYVAFPAHRRAMIWASVLTTPFGLTEPFFVPEYWSPPSLFDLALRTGFDIESLIFTFGIGGVGAVIVNILRRRDTVPLDAAERQHPRHRFHRPILVSPVVVFALLFWLPWNPIYPGIVAMAVGAGLGMWCRPDLKASTLIGGVVFLLYYAVFLLGLEVTAAGYIERVWNLEALSGVNIWLFPLEELLFALTFGMYWAGVYEHITWHRSVHHAT